MNERKEGRTGGRKEGRTRERKSHRGERGCEENVGRNINVAHATAQRDEKTTTIAIKPNDKLNLIICENLQIVVSFDKFVNDFEMEQNKDSNMKLENDGCKSVFFLLTSCTSYLPIFTFFA